MRKKWNTVQQDYFVFFGKEKKPWWYLPFAVLFYQHCSRVAYSTIPLGVKFELWGILIYHELSQTVLKVLIKVVGLLSPKRWMQKLGCEIYWRWMHSPNVVVKREDFFLERVIKPKVGWWR